MPPRPRRKTAKRSPKLKPGKKGALVHFTATQKITVRPNKPRADGGDGGVWVLVGSPSWMKTTNKGVNRRTKMAAIKALRKFRKR